MAKAVYNTLPDEQSLLQQTAEGSREAFAILYAHYYPGLYRFVSFIVASPEDSEEIMQDVFLKVWAKRDTLIGIRAFDSYLFRMARNRIFDLSRQSQLRLKIVREAGRQPQTSADSPYEGLLFQEYYRVAQQAINRLPTRRKQIFLMNARDELTAREIADKLGMTRLAVKKQLYEASHFIKDELRKNADLFLLFLFFLK